MISVSANTKAILLLTAPLFLGKNNNNNKIKLLSNKEYHQLTIYLRSINKQPEDLLTSDCEDILYGYPKLDSIRIKQLLNRGFLLSQVLDYWHSRNIWVISRADRAYPNRLKSRLAGNAPPILYGCGNMDLLNLGGLAIVGSRNINDDLISYTMRIAELSAKAEKMIISGGAKGADLSAMQGVLDAGGLACTVLANGLEKEALNAANRLALQENRLIFISACDPRSRFSIGNAMQRNKYIYALADAGLIINAELNKGGTWSGAIEQLKSYRQIPIYVRSTEGESIGLNALVSEGAALWPNPNNIKDFSAILANNRFNEQENTLLHIREPDRLNEYENNEQTPAQKLFLFVKELIENNLQEPKQETELVELLGVSKSQIKLWLNRLMDEGIVVKYSKTHYILHSYHRNLRLFE